MNWKGTAALVVVAMGLGAYVYFVESKKDAPKALGDDATTVDLWNLKDSKDLERIMLSDDQGHQTSYFKDATGWHSTKAASSSLESFNWDGPFDYLAKLTAERKADDRPTDLAPFGLATPSLTIHLGSKAKPEQYQVKIGSKHPLDPQHFMRTNQGEAVYTVADYKLESWQRLLKQPPIATPSPVVPAASDSALATP